MTGSEQFVHNSKCPDCGKLLTKPVLEIGPGTLLESEYAHARAGMTLKYGAESKCKRCKNLYKTMRDISTASS